MTDTTPPPEAQRFGRSQTPESPRPVHLPEPQNIPVLVNQMDPVFNDTNTYNISSNTTFSPISDPNRSFPEASTEESDPVQSFLNNAEVESARPQEQTSYAPKTEETRPEAGSSNQAIDEAKQSGDPSEQGLIFQNESDQVEASKHQQLDLTESEDAPATTNLAQSQAENTLSASGGAIAQEVPATDRRENHEGGVDYQSLLDTIAQSASTAPAADSMTAPTTASHQPDQNTSPLSSVPGLPPKPPVQTNVADLVQSTGIEPPQTLISIPAAENSEPAQLQPGAVGYQEMALPIQMTDVLSAGAEPSSSAYNPYETNGTGLALQSAPGVEIDTGPIVGGVYEESKWSVDTQRVYDLFLEDERRYVTEGIWDKFPQGSRLFVGNLPSEKVTKRDLFHIFHRHGRLAQISIKQAYGFVQFLESASCYNALAAEQGVEIRGRKIHLEVSKPQKNTRGGNKNARRRSRSPERPRNINDRNSRPNLGEFREESGRRREEFRRSISPPRYRSRDDYRPQPTDPRNFQPQDNRTRSPYAAFPPPFQAPYDEDATLQLPRRHPRDVPDVTVLILDANVGHGFINYVEEGFKAKGLRAATIWLSPRLPLQAVIKRQILEGVHAIVKLIHQDQFKGKVPLQVFDRSAGASNVNFNEYVDLDVQVAADIVLHTKQRAQPPAQHSPQAQFPSNLPFNAPNLFQHPNLPQQQQHQAYQQPTPHFQQPRPPNVQNPYPYQQPPQHSQPPTPGSANSQSSNLQQLLANLRQPQDSQNSPQSPPSAQAGGRQPDLGGLLSNIAAHQQNQQHAYGQPTGQPVQMQYGHGAGAQGYAQGQQPNVQNIMEQLARYQR